MLTFSEQAILNKHNVFEPENENFWFQAVEVDPEESGGWYRAYGYIHLVGKEIPKPAVLWFVPELDDRACESAEELFHAPWKEWEVSEVEEGV